jgi:hypothetical protein
VQKDRRWTDNKSDVLNETNRVVRDTWEDLQRLRACIESSSLMIRQSQRLIAEISGGGTKEIIGRTPIIIPPTPRNDGTTWAPKQGTSSEFLVAEARHVRARVMQAYQSCLRAKASFTKAKENTGRLMREATEVLRWDVGWRL